MEWILLSLASAFFLGVYDVAKKWSVRENAVAPVLLLNVTTAALLWLPLVIISPWHLEAIPIELDELNAHSHLLLSLKSLLVGASWTLAFFSLKHLPISIAIPIRATSPFWTIVIAVACFGERPSWTQWMGMVVVLVGFIAFSGSGHREGIYFHRNRWVVCMIGATLLGSISALYDKYLLQIAKFSPATVQAWFSIYLVPIMIPLAVRWYYFDRSTQPFRWRWSIPAVAVSLLVADFLYFRALTYPEAMISIISPIRRTSVVIPFVVGVIWLAEKSWQRKAICITVMLAGVLLLSSTR